MIRNRNEEYTDEYQSKFANLMLWIRYDEQPCKIESNDSLYKIQPGDVEILEYAGEAKYSIFGPDVHGYFDDVDHCTFCTNVKEELKLWLAIRHLKIGRVFCESRYIMDDNGYLDWRWLGFDLIKE